MQINELNMNSLAQNSNTFPSTQCPLDVDQMKELIRSFFLHLLDRLLKAGIILCCKLQVAVRNNSTVRSYFYSTCRIWLRQMSIYVSSASPISPFGRRAAHITDSASGGLPRTFTATETATNTSDAFWSMIGHCTSRRKCSSSFT